MFILRTLAFLFLLGTVTMARGQIFNAGATVGVTASQIRGDNLAGFDKLGLQGGLVLTADLDDTKLLRMEFLYTQKGSRRDLFPGTGGDPFTIQIDYFEVPILFTLKDWDSGDDFYHFHFSGGFSYARLINQNADNTFYEAETENFTTNDVSWLLDISYFPSANIGVGVRYTRSINLLYDSREHMPSLNSLRAFFLSFRAIYLI